MTVDGNIFQEPKEEIVKTIRRLNSLILATIMMLTVLALPASAEVGGRWKREV